MLQQKACCIKTCTRSTSVCFVQHSSRALHTPPLNLRLHNMNRSTVFRQIRCSAPGGGEETPLTGSTGLDTPTPAQTTIPLTGTWVDTARSALKAIVDNRRIVAVAIAVADVLFLWLAVKGYKIWEAGEH